MRRTTPKCKPALRFKDKQGKDLPDWEETTLGKLASFSKGKGISKNDVLGNGSVKCIRYGELYTHYGAIISKVLSRTNLPIDELVLGQRNDVIIPSSGETALGIAAIACITIENIALGGDINIVRSDQNGIFLAYYLISKKKDIARLAQGISVIHLYNKQLKTLILNIPSKSEQQEIASFLSSVDKKIEQLRQKKDLLERYKKGLMQQLFSREIRFKDEQGKYFLEWEMQSLDDVSIIIMGTSPNSTAYNQNQRGIPLIQGNADINNRKSAPRMFTSEFTKVCQFGDTLISVRAPVGEVASSNHYACIGRGIAAVRAKGNSLQKFLYAYLIWAEPKWRKISQGSTFQSVNSKDVRSFRIYLPSKPEQQKIANFLSAIDAKIEQVSLQIEHAQEFKKGLLQKMFV